MADTHQDAALAAVAMLDIDILTTFIACGAAACVAALMTMLVRADEPMLDSALRISSVGFAVLGVSLVQLLGGVRGPDALPMVLALLGSSCGITIIGWGLLRLAGHRVPPARPLFTTSTVRRPWCACWAFSTA